MQITGGVAHVRHQLQSHLQLAGVAVRAVHAGGVAGLPAAATGRQLRRHRAHLEQPQLSRLSAHPVHIRRQHLLRQPVRRHDIPQVRPSLIEVFGKDHHQ